MIGVKPNQQATWAVHAGSDINTRQATKQPEIDTQGLHVTLKNTNLASRS